MPAHTKGGYVALDGAPPASREAYEAWLNKLRVLGRKGD